MRNILKMYAVLGMLWAAGVIVWIILYCRQEGIPLIWSIVVLYTALFLASWRCYCERRIAALLCCGYCVWETFIGYQLGIPDWTYFWGVTTLIFTALTCLNWSGLKDGI